MQMLGLQALFGFVFQALFQPGFAQLDPLGRQVAAAGLLVLAAALGVILSAPSQHRLVEHGEVTPRIHHVATVCGRIALAPIAFGTGLVLLFPLQHSVGRPVALAFSGGVLVLALLAWYLLPLVLRPTISARARPHMQQTRTTLHARIQQMLTESRVILPGTQALLGFQLIVLMTPAFGELPGTVRAVHVAGLACLAIAVVLLVAPAAVHRVGFGGAEDPRVHVVGSRLVTAALVPFALALALDVYVALYRLFGSTAPALGMATAVLGLLAALWFALPLVIRRRERLRTRQAARVAAGRRA